MDEITTTVVCPGLVDTEWSAGANHGNTQAMSAGDVAQAIWGRHISIIHRWTQQEPTLLHHGNVP